MHRTPTAAVTRVALIDDERAERDALCEDLNLAGSFQVEAIPYGKLPDVISAVRLVDPGLILVDWQLTTSPSGDYAKPQHGDALAVLLRESFAGVPVIVITKGTLFDSGEVQWLKGGTGAYLDVLNKKKPRGGPDVLASPTDGDCSRLRTT